MFTIPDQEVLSLFVGKTLAEASQVVGEIYTMRCKTTGKKYVGQTRTHAQNRNKYRPTGYIRRTSAHFSEAKHNKRGFECTYLNNAIRKYGEEDFEIELLMRCPVEDLHAWEIHWIHKLETLAPDGYNLTSGGKILVKDTIKAEDKDKVFEKTPRNAPKTPEAIAKWSASSRAFYATPEGFRSMSDRVQKYRLEKAIVKWQDMDTSKPDEEYLHVQRSKDQSVTGVIVYFGNGRRVKYPKVSEEEGLRRGREFLKRLREHQANIKAQQQTATLPN